MTRLRRTLTRTALWLALGMTNAFADATEDLKRFFSETSSYTAEFEQVVVDETGAEIDRSGGMFWIERPGRFRWEYSRPSEQIIVGTGESIWIYDVELEQATQRRSADAISQTPAALLAGEGELEANFSMEDLGRHEGLDRVAMRPRDTDVGFNEIRIGFRDGRLAVLELQDAFDQTTRMQFSGVRENIDIPAERFAFTPPEGIDVIVE